MRKKKAKSFKSLTQKLLYMFLFSLMTSLVISFILHYAYFRPYYLNHQEKRLLDIYEQVEASLHHSDFYDIIAELDYSKQVDVSIADTNFRNAVRTQSSGGIVEERIQPDLHSVFTKEFELLDSGTALYTSITEDGAHPRLVMVKKLSNGKFCILSQPWEQIESNMEAVTDFHFLVGGIACLISILTTLFLARRFTKPIIEISTATEGLSKLDFKQKITYQSQDELGQLATSINVLSKRLEEHRDSLKSEIAFQKVLSQNMSHELKTPISVMKGYLEGVLYGVVETQEEQNEYLNVVLSECDRMTVLIDSMLHLSKLTSFQESGLEMNPFTTEELAKKIQEHSSILLEKNEMSLESKVTSGTMYGNFELLVQAVGNFVSNAVKYGDHKRVCLQIEEVKDVYEISLYNSGQILPESEWKQIFGVFYMIDKARSRSSNSHGLGLSVTQTIAQLHRGTVGCCSAEDGMIFTITIPIIPS